MQKCGRVDARYDGSILAKIPFTSTPYKIILNDSNEYGCYFFKNLIILIFE
jgi:hypothetical protein